MSVLADMPMFTGLDPARLTDIATTSRHAAFQRGQTIFSAGETAGEICVLLSGQVKRASVSHCGHEKVIDLVFPGQSFGEAELFSGHPYSSSATAVEPSAVLCVGGDSLRRTMAEDAGFASRIVATLANRQIAIESSIAASHSRSGTQRLLGFLMQQAGGPLPPAGETVIKLTTSKQIIASRLGITRETFSRALRDLSDAGLVILDGRSVRLQNARIARRMADIQAGRALDPGEGAAAFPANDDALLPLPGAVNIAGRQRMLSQRMAKSWLMLGRGVLPGRARTALDQSIRLFEQQMAMLERLPVSRDVRAAQAAVSELWQPYKTLLGHPPGLDEAHRLFDLNEELLAAAQNLTQAYERAVGTDASRLINLAGRERMLSQRLAKLYLFHHWGIHAGEAQLGIDEARTEFDAALAELLAASHDQPQLQSQLEVVTHHWKLLQSALAASGPADFRRRAAAVVTASEHLLRQMDAAVTMVEKLAA